MLDRIVSRPIGYAGGFGITGPREVDPGLAYVPRNRQRRRPAAGLTDTQSCIVEYVGNVGGVESAGSVLQNRGAPTENVLVGRRSAERGLELALRDVHLAPIGGRDGGPQTEWSLFGILAAVGRNDVA